MLVLFVLLVPLYVLFVLVVFVDIILLPYSNRPKLLTNRILTKENIFRLKNKFVCASPYSQVNWGYLQKSINILST